MISALVAIASAGWLAAGVAWMMRQSAHKDLALAREEVKLAQLVATGLRRDLTNTTTAANQLREMHEREQRAAQIATAEADRLRKQLNDLRTPGSGLGRLKGS